MKLFLKFVAAMYLGSLAILFSASEPVIVGGVDISKWRGFNLMEQYNVGKEKPFLESDFKAIAADGFNFVRLPLDYRIYESSNEPGKYLEEGLKELDRAVVLGMKYKLHVSLNLHKAPGFCINQGLTTIGLQDRLWTNTEVQEQFLNLWTMFAKRYRQIPAESLSFNLLNEPSRVDASIFIDLMKRTVAAIGETDPKRLIVMDGFSVGTVPQAELYRLPNVITAIRGYAPDKLTHYKAEWLKGAEEFPLPQWPYLPKLPGFFYGPEKPEIPKGEMMFKGNFPAGTKVEFMLEQVSKRAFFLIRADGATVFERDFVPGPGEGEWKEVIFKNGMYQNLYGKRYAFELSSPAKSISLRVTNGDWLKTSEWRFRFPDGTETALTNDLAWGRAPMTMTFEGGKWMAPSDFDGEYPVKNPLAVWKNAIANGAKVFVGEMGVYKHTPHDVTLRWFESCLREYQSMNVGWALWNYRGSMGVADSGRSDVKYEEKNGVKIDRQLMEILKRYLPVEAR